MSKFVTFLARVTWHSVQIYNYLTNKWTCEKQLTYDPAFPATKKKIVSVKIQDEKIVTIENLTSFFSFSRARVCAVYLGGFCNHLRRDFLMKVYRSEPNKQYFHFGDIDAGGFYIFDDLCEKTGIPFQPFSMDIDTLYSYKSYWKELTKNDVMRLQKIKTPVFQEVISYMLEQNCKLEQEVLDLV